MFMSNPFALVFLVHPVLRLIFFHVMKVTGAPIRVI